MVPTVAEQARLSHSSAPHCVWVWGVGDTQTPEPLSYRCL